MELKKVDKTDVDIHNSAFASAINALFNLSTAMHKAAKDGDWSRYYAKREAFDSNIRDLVKREDKLRYVLEHYSFGEAKPPADGDEQT